MSASWYIYTLPPIDFWMGWTCFDMFVWQMTEDYSPWTPDEARAMLRTASLLVHRYTDWEMDRDVTDWHITALPLDEPEPAFAFAIKQANNGTVFVASQLELPWLSDYISATVPASWR